MGLPLHRIAHISKIRILIVCPYVMCMTIYVMYELIKRDIVIEMDLFWHMRICINCYHDIYIYFILHSNFQHYVCMRYYIRRSNGMFQVPLPAVQLPMTPAQCTPMHFRFHVFLEFVHPTVVWSPFLSTHIEFPLGCFRSSQPRADMSLSILFRIITKCKMQCYESIYANSNNNAILIIYCKAF